MLRSRQPSGVGKQGLFLFVQMAIAHSLDPSAFAVDDHLNQVMADWYGIVMGTSHEEPMMRSIPVEWSLFGVGPWDYSTNAQFIYNFWVNSTIRAKPFENIFTVGMRGDGDRTSNLYRFWGGLSHANPSS